MARSTDPEVTVGHDQVARVRVHLDEADNLHWATLMTAQGVPPGGTSPVDVESGKVTMAVETTHLQDSLTWLEEAVSNVNEQWKDDEHRRLLAESEASSTVERWWQRVRW